MKQPFLFLILAAFFYGAYAQDKKIEFQVSAGTTLSVPKTSKLSNTNLDGSPEIKSSINLGAYILPSFNYLLNDKISLEFGLGFYLDRFAFKDKIGGLTSKVNRNINQIQIPINVNFSFGKNNSYQLGAGGFSSFLISARAKSEQSIDASEFNFFTDSDAPINDEIFVNTRFIDYNENIKNQYNTISFGGFIKLRKNISFSSNTKGFLVLKINQYFNAIKNIDKNSLLAAYGAENEKEPTTVNLGVGIIL